jgi:cold shock protein
MRKIMSDRKTGVVKWFNAKKGFGFIAQDGGEDIFVHYRNIRGDGYRALQEGDKVEFTLINGPKGLQADDVAVI